MTDQKAVIDISAPDLWADVRFHGMLLKGLENDGFGGDVIALVAEALKALATPSFDSLCAGLEQTMGGLEPSLKQELARLRDFLKDTIAFNKSIYQIADPAVARVRRWPNNVNLKARYPEQHFDIHEDQFFIEPHRFITKDTPVGSAGSCFAMRIAHQLQFWDYNYVIEEDDLPADIPIENLSDTAYRMAPARMGTLYNVPSLRQMVERAFGEWEAENVISRGHENRIRDLFRTISRPVDLDAYAAEYEAHNAALRRALSKCEVFILTLGLTEAWYLAHSGNYIAVDPARVDATLLRRRNLTVEENLEELERLLEVYRRHCPDIKLIISVSPVPFNKTFSTAQHVVVANCLSKATLVVAAHEFVRRHPDCTEYFPSYEMVMYGTPKPWEDDMRHVSPEAIERVMTLFQKLYLVDQTPLPIHRHVPPTPPASSLFRTMARKLLLPVRSFFRRMTS